MVELAAAAVAAGRLMAAWNWTYLHHDVGLDADRGGYTLGGMLADTNSYFPDGVSLLRSSI